MKKSLLATLMAFASIGMYANTNTQSIISKVNVSVPVADTLPTPDFVYYARPVGQPYPGASLVAFIVSVPVPGQHDLIGSVSWDFGDGTPPVLNTTGITNHPYYQPGTYDVTMTFTFSTGETVVIVKPVTITF